MRLTGDLDSRIAEIYRRSRGFPGWEQPELPAWKVRSPTAPPDGERRSPRYPENPHAQRGPSLPPRRANQPRAMKRERDRSRTVVAGIVKRTVTATPDVRFTAKRVRGPDRILHLLGSPLGRIGNPVAQNRPAARHRRAITAAFHLRLILLLNIIVAGFGSRTARRRSLVRHAGWFRAAPQLIVVSFGPRL